MRYLACICLLLVACGNPPAPHTVVFDAGTTAPSMLVTLSDPSGQQLMTAVPGWSWRTIVPSGGLVQVAVTSNGDTEYTRCSITVDGKEVVSKRSPGANSAVMCTATVP